MAKLSAIEVFLGLLLGGALFGWRANKQMKRLDDLEKTMLAVIEQQNKDRGDIRDLQDGNLHLAGEVKAMCRSISSLAESFKEYKFSNVETYKAIGEEIRSNQKSNTELVKALVSTITNK